ncbi:MAG: DUF349 domain-containing protein [Wenzhouxiangella sp.]|nr:MAG: DUF349 domain-containing protein [Wenzhouxiangella sp.]
MAFMAFDAAGPMNLKSRFFKKPWQSKDPSTRAEAVRDGGDPELKSELPRIAQHDESADVRLAALKKINSEPFWLDARLRESDPEIVAAADAFLARSVLRCGDEAMRDSRLQWLAKIGDEGLMRRFAVEAEDVDLRRAALARVEAQGFLGDCYGKESDDGLAAEILARIEQPSTLERLSDQLRKTRKRRAQAAATRLRDIRIAAGELDPDQTAASELVREMEALAKGQGVADRGERLAELTRTWSELEQKPEALARRFDGAVAIVRSAMDRPARGAEPVVSEVPVDSPETSANPGLEQAAARIRNVIRQADKRVSPAELLSSWDRAWSQVGSPSESDTALKDDILPLLRELQAQIEQSKTPPPPKPDEPKPGAELPALLDGIAEVLENGDIAQAHELIGKARSVFRGVPPRARAREVGGRLQRMEGRLKEMRNYQHWSHNKHRDELIAQVEALPGSGQHPDAISALLKQAREEWQRLEALEVLPGDRKRFAAPPGQWRRFQAACKQAFDTAKPYFEKRQEVQTENLELLDQFIAMGQELAGSEKPDPNQLRELMTKARAAIRRMDDLPPKARGRSAGRLRELMDQISNKQNELFAEIELVKRRLITEAKALVHEKDTKVAIDKAKALQAQWQKAGSGRRKLEQKLWEEFRTPIDPLFDQLKGEREEQKQADREAMAELKAICEQAEALAKVADDELEAAEGRMAGLVADWSGREGRTGKLNQRMEKAEAALAARLQARLERLRESHRERLEQLAAAIQQAAELKLAGKDSEGALPMPEANPGDSELEQALVQAASELARLEAESDALEARLAQGDEAARQLVVEIEFLGGMETPPEDRKLRMDYQVQRLAQRMSERNAQPDLSTELGQLQERWYRSLPHTPSRHHGYSKRFVKARSIIEGMIGL